jgi:long-chain acyl-CoA synthetase
MIRASGTAMNALSRFAIAASLALLIAGGARAAEVAGIKLDEKASLSGQELALNGAGIRTRLMFKVYVASLYLPKRATDLPGVLTQAPRRIQLNMLRNVSADQLADALNEGLEANNSAADLAAVKAQTDQLLGIMKAFKEVKEKDVIALDFVEGATRVSWNGDAKGTISGAAFNQALTRIWLGDKPAQADLKQALLGG